MGYLFDQSHENPEVFVRRVLEARDPRFAGYEAISSQLFARDPVGEAVIQSAGVPVLFHRRTACAPIAPNDLRQSSRAIVWNRGDWNRC